MTRKLLIGKQNLNKREVYTLLGWGRRTLTRKISAGTFPPAAFSRGTRAQRWPTWQIEGIASGQIDPVAEARDMAARELRRGRTA